MTDPTYELCCHINALAAEKERLKELANKYREASRLKAEKMLEMQSEIDRLKIALRVLEPGKTASLLARWDATEPSLQRLIVAKLLVTQMELLDRIERLNQSDAERINP